MTHPPGSPSGRTSRSVRMWGLALLAVLLLTAAIAPPANAVRCLTPDMKQLWAAQGPPPAGPFVRTHQPGDPMTPPPNPQVGDSWLWYLWYFAGGPPHTHQTMCTVRGLGTNVYVIVDDAIWGTMVDQTDVDNVVAAWDSHSYGNWPTQGIFELNSSNFGQPPDMLDGDPRIYVVLYDWDVTGADGFWNVGDEYPDGVQGPSNECECLYVDASTSDPGGPGGAYLTAVQAHEFEHMIMWGHDHFEQTWLDEGMAELAMWFYGRPDQVSGFPSNPDNGLTAFSTYSDYVKVYLWSLYFYEHFGGQAAILDLVARTTTGLISVGQTLTAMGYTMTTADLMRDWYTANWLDDPTLDGGKYNYVGEDLPPFYAPVKTTYPVPNTNATVSALAGEYIKFTNGVPQRLNFDGFDTSDWTARIIKSMAGTPLSVEDIPLNSTDTGTFDLVGFGTSYDQVVLLVGRVTGSGSSGAYTYGTTSLPSDAGEPLIAGGLRLIETGANPFGSDASVRLILDRPSDVRASVLDVRGGVVRLLVSGPLAAGSHDLKWDGRDAAGHAVSNGVYFLRAHAADGRSDSRRLVLAR